MAKGTYGDQNGKDKPIRKPGGVGAGFDAPFRGYINLSLSDEQKSTYAAWEQSASLWTTLEAAVSDGINISLKFNPKDGAFLATATQRREGSPNAGLCVTARGGSASVAWGRVLFCLAILGHKERWEDTQPLASPDRW